MEKKRNGRYTAEFREMAVERMRTTSDVTALAKELGVHRVMLYRWAKGRLAAEVEAWSGDAEKHRLAVELKRTREQLAEKIVELDFLKEKYSAHNPAYRRVHAVCVNGQKSLIFAGF